MASIREQSDDSTSRHSKRPFQFRLLELFVVITTFAVCFGMVGGWGIQGFFDRLQVAMFVAGLALTVMELHSMIKENLGS
jgi:hypothetical protein